MAARYKKGLNFAKRKEMTFGELTKYVWEFMYKADGIMVSHEGFLLKIMGVLKEKES